jgi:predicted PhzF superfamily epimerase YddE/YHI9
VIADRHLRRVFSGADARGNLCRVVEGSLGAWSQPGGVTACCTWKNSRGVVQVTCYTSEGRPIRCCGHGLLATADYWLDRAASESLVLWMGESGVACHRDAQTLWASFVSLPVHPVPVPLWAQSIFSSAPVSAATAGGQDGYLVLEWPQDFPLASLSPPGEELRRCTGRALIVCARSAGDYDIRLRYFAPQYGVVEDPATGSAMRVLAAYCRARHRLDQLKAFQCSPSGGVLYSRIDGGRVAIGGRVEQVEFHNGDY